MVVEFVDAEDVPKKIKNILVIEIIIEIVKKNLINIDIIDKDQILKIQEDQSVLNPKKLFYLIISKIQF